MLQLIVRKIINVSEEHNASILSIEGQAKEANNRQSEPGERNPDRMKRNEKCNRCWP
jgi:hypothetical protein